MAKTLLQILGYTSLTGVIKKIQTGIPDNLPSSFHKVGQKVIGDSGRYMATRGTRQTARRSEYGSPARNRALKDLASQDIKLIHTFESITLNPLILQQLRNYDNYDVQRLGEQEVDRQSMEFRKYFDNLRISCMYSMLSLGAIYFDSEGNLLPSSSGALALGSGSYDYNISANNKNQLNGIIDASWANNNTDIPAQLRNLRIRSAQLTGYPLKYAFYGLNIPSYLTQNNYVLDYLSRNPVFAQKFLDAAEIPDGLFGFTWVPVYTSFFEDSANTNQTFFGSDTVVFTPEINSDVYELIEGSMFVPGSFQPASNVAAALSSAKQVWGMASYAKLIDDPITAKMYYFDTFAPAWKVEDALFIGDVTP